MVSAATAARHTVLATAGLMDRYASHLGGSGRWAVEPSVVEVVVVGAATPGSALRLTAPCSLASVHAAVPLSGRSPGTRGPRWLEWRGDA